MLTWVVGMGRAGEWTCLLLCFFLLSFLLIWPTPGRAQEADDALSEDEPFADDGLSDEDDPALAAIRPAARENASRLARTNSLN